MTWNPAEYDKEKLKKLIELVDAGVRASGQSGVKENPVPFNEKFMAAKKELSESMPIFHRDPNVNFVVAMSLMAAAWSGCIPRAKLFRPLDEPDGAGRISNDDDRRKSDHAH